MLRFLQRAPQWLSRPAQISQEAQVRALLKLLIRHVTTERDRRVKRYNILENDITERTTSVEEQLQDAQRQHDLLTELGALDNPVHRLLLTAVYLPSQLQQEDVAAASAHRQGGAQALLRTPDEAVWALLVQATTADEPEELGLIAWKERVAEIFRCPTPLGEAAASERERARSWLDRTLHRARSALTLRFKARQDSIHAI